MKYCIFNLINKKKNIIKPNKKWILLHTIIIDNYFLYVIFKKK